MALGQRTTQGHDCKTVYEDFKRFKRGPSRASKLDKRASKNLRGATHSPNVLYTVERNLS